MLDEMEQLTKQRVDLLTVVESHACLIVPGPHDAADSAACGYWRNWLSLWLAYRPFTGVRRCIQAWDFQAETGTIPAAAAALW